MLLNLGGVRESKCSLLWNAAGCTLQETTSQQGTDRHRSAAVLRYLWDFTHENFKGESTDRKNGVITTKDPWDWYVYLHGWVLSD